MRVTEIGDHRNRDGSPDTADSAVAGRVVAVVLAAESGALPICDLLTRAGAYIVEAAELAELGASELVILVEDDGTLAERVRGVVEAAGLPAHAFGVVAPVEFLSAMAVHDPHRSLADDAAAMQAAAASTRSAVVGPASDDQLTLDAVWAISQLLVDGGDLVTVVSAEEIGARIAHEMAAIRPDIDVNHLSVETLAIGGLARGGVMADLDTPLKSIIGGKTAKILAEELDLHTVGDLLRHYPRRWEKRGELTDLGELEVGEYATIFASVAGVSSKAIRRDLYKTDVSVTDGSKKLTLTFFSKRDWQKGRFAVGDRVFFSGKVGEFNHKPQLLNPEVEAVPDDADEAASGFAGAILSIYPASKGATTLDIRRSMQVALDSVDLPEDPVPVRIRKELQLLDYREALEGIHRPKTFAERDRAPPPPRLGRGVRPADRVGPTQGGRCRSAGHRATSGQ